MKNALIMVFVAAAGAMFNYYAATLMILGMISVKGA
jgi:hypothetical protein